jgi:hypothetical protein
MFLFVYFLSSCGTWVSSLLWRLDAIRRMKQEIPEFYFKWGLTYIVHSRSYVWENIGFWGFCNGTVASRSRWFGFKNAKKWCDVCILPKDRPKCTQMGSSGWYQEKEYGFHALIINSRTLSKQGNSRGLYPEILCTKRPKIRNRIMSWPPANYGQEWVKNNFQLYIWA